MTYRGYEFSVYAECGEFAWDAISDGDIIGRGYEETEDDAIQAAEEIIDGDIEELENR